MWEQLRNLSNPPGAFGTHEGAVLGMAAISVLLLFAGPALWAIVYLLNERSGRGVAQPPTVEANAQGTLPSNQKDDRERLKAA